MQLLRYCEFLLNLKGDEFLKSTLNIYLTNKLVYILDSTVIKNLCILFYLCCSVKILFYVYGNVVWNVKVK